MNENVCKNEKSEKGVNSAGHVNVIYSNYNSYEYLREDAIDSLISESFDTEEPSEGDILD